MINHKRTVTKWMLLAALPALLLAACSKEHVGVITPGPATAGGDIKFDIGFAPQTRVTTDAVFKSTWEDGDEIGIFAVTSGTSLSATASENDINNAKLIYDGGTWVQETPLYWQGSAKFDFYAYYPFDKNATNPKNITFNVAVDQSSDTDGKLNYNLSDLLTAKADNSGSGYGKGSTVSLTFSHALAMMQVNIPKGGTGWGADGSQRVTLQNVKAKAAVNLAGCCKRDAGKRRNACRRR